MSDRPPRLRPTALEWCVLVVGAVLVVRYAWVMDDAFIYARYADNAVAMHVGLVYNAGEFVEGYSSPAWMLWVLGLRLCGLSFWHIFLATGLAAFALFWWLIVRTDAALARGRPRLGLVLAYLAVNYAVLTWFTSGMETPLIQLAAAGYALHIARPNSRTAQLLVGLSPLIRPELLLPLVVVLLHGLARRRLPRLALAVAALTGGLWLAFRIYYYADLLPTTFYLKDVPNPLQGLRYAANAFLPYHLELLLLTGALALARARRRDPALAPDLEPRLVMLAASLPVVAYVIRIGGDAVHFRYLAFPFCLAACSATSAIEAWLSTLPKRQARVAYPLAGLATLALSFAFQPPQRTRHAIFGVAPENHIHEISDPDFHRSRQQLYLAAAIDLHAAAKRAIGQNPAAFVYTDTHPHDWCANNYVWYGRRIVHKFGLTDPILARMPVHGRRPGHKYGLFPYAEDLARLHDAVPPGPGMFRTAVERGIAPRWIVHNLESLERIARKTYNNHDFAENLRLAFTFPAPLRP